MASKHGIGIVCLYRQQKFRTLNNNDQSLSNRLPALSLCRSHGRNDIAKDINEDLNQEKILYRRWPSQILLNLRYFHLEATLDNTNSD